MDGNMLQRGILVSYGRLIKLLFVSGKKCLKIVVDNIV